MPKVDLPIDRCEEILDREEFGYLGMSRGGQPYCIPVNFVYSRGRIYIHTGLKGLKWEFLAENPRVCFTVSAPGAKRTGESPCQYTYEFESVIVFGTASKAEDPDSLEYLNRLIDKYRTAPVLPAPEEKLAKLLLIRIDIEEISGRQNL